MKAKGAGPYREVINSIESTERHKTGTKGGHKSLQLEVMDASNETVPAEWQKRKPNFNELKRKRRFF